MSIQLIAQIARFHVAIVLLINTAAMFILAYMRGFSTTDAIHEGNKKIRSFSNEERSRPAAAAQAKRQNMETVGLVTTGLLCAYATVRLASLSSPIGIVANVISGATLLGDAYFIGYKKILS